MSQGVLSGILRPVSEEESARVEREAAERMAARRSQAARKGAATRKARREADEAQGRLVLSYSTWNPPRIGKGAFKQEKQS